MPEATGAAGGGVVGSTFDTLSTDLTELILGRLPLPSILRASAVCKPWRSLISAPAFPSSPASPWFFLVGLHNTSSRNHQSFAFDPLSFSWFSLPSAFLDNGHDPSSSSLLIASSGFLFSTTPSFSFTRLFSPAWRLTSPLHFPRINPLLAVYDDSSSSTTSTPRFVVVGGVRFIGNLVDIEDRLAVEIYDPRSDSWDLCSPLPPDFRSGNSSQSLSSALFKGSLYVFGIYSSFVSAFDLETRVWSGVQTLRPPGAIFSFLIACSDRLILAGVCRGPVGPSFNLWEVDEGTMEFSEIAVMPQELLYGLVDSEEADDKFESLKCVGSGHLIYVFNEEYHKKYPACVCEVGGDKKQCTWRRLPDLPSPVNKFHKVISFCSAVTIRDVLSAED